MVRQFGNAHSEGKQSQSRSVHPAEDRPGVRGEPHLGQDERNHEQSEPAGVCPHRLRSRGDGDEDRGGSDHDRQDGAGNAALEPEAKQKSERPGRHADEEGRAIGEPKHPRVHGPSPTSEWNELRRALSGPRAFLLLQLNVKIWHRVALLDAGAVEAHAVSERMRVRPRGPRGHDA